MEYSEAERHTKACFAANSTISANSADGINGNCQKPGDFWGNEVSQVVERRAKEVARYKEYVM